MEIDFSKRMIGEIEAVAASRGFADARSYVKSVIGKEIALQQPQITRVQTDPHTDDWEKRFRQWASRPTIQSAHPIDIRRQAIYESRGE